MKRIKLIFLSELILNCIVEPLKKKIRRKRPDQFFKFNLFPSSHTATSFSGAHILHHEMKKDMPALSFAAYPIAITTAILRLYKKKHWLLMLSQAQLLVLLLLRWLIQFLIRKEGERLMIN